MHGRDSSFFSHHQQTNKVLDHLFIESFDHNTKILLDSVIGGICKKINKVLATLLNCIKHGYPKWQSDGPRSMAKHPACMTQVDSITSLVTQLASFQNQMMTRFNKVSMAQPQAKFIKVQTQLKLYNSIGHSSDLYGSNTKLMNIVANAQNANQNYGNANNPNWKSHSCYIMYL